MTEAEVNKTKLIRYKCENSLLFYARYIFKENNGTKFKVYPHVIKMLDALEQVASGQVKRLIINMPPRYYKTEIVIKIFVSWTLMLNPRAKFIHLSYADNLALNNSSITKGYINSQGFQRLRPMKMKFDEQGKQLWTNQEGGGMYATSTGGPVTGFGAGLAPPAEEDRNLDNPFADFSGAILIDDPNKPDDIDSDVKRTTVNDRYNNTIKNRVNHRDVPIIVIQQRLHEEDLSGFLLDGGSEEEWTHLNLPVLDENNVPLCPDKHTFEEIEQIRLADRYSFSGQYMQQPSPEAGDILKREWFEIIERAQLPAINSWEMVIDGAYTKLSKNDPTGLMIWGKYKNDIYVLHSTDKHLEMPELLKYIPRFIRASRVHVGMCRIEPKASGITLDQLIKKHTKLNSSQIKTKFARVGKEERAKMASSYIEGGRVFLVKGSWNEGFLAQCAMFPNGKHDEHIDMISYAVERGLIISNRSKAY